MAITLTLESTAYTLDQLTARPEAQIALAGRSNVGKSSLVNALADR
ncbi:MAG: 50S ribosome-binding GTPase, partial [Desulfovibrio sp.]|nr:50S ribosome-binding GTPase [Desulfovibrio sp.]